MIHRMVSELAHKINRDLSDKKEIYAVGVLDACFMFYSDFLRELHFPVIADFMKISFYKGEKTAQNSAKFERLPKYDLKNKTVLVIDTIADTGKSFITIDKYLREIGVNEVFYTALVCKPLAKNNIHIHFKGFSVDQDEFIVGYGTDYKGKYRNLFNMRTLD